MSKLVEKISAQYGTSSSEKESLTEANQQAVGYYQRLHRALPDGVAHAGRCAAPVFYLAEPSTDGAELLMVGADFPPLVSIPDPERIGATIMYGVARAFLEHHPAILTELTSLVQKHLPEQQNMVSGLIGDVVSKLAGIALVFDPAKLKEYFLTPTKPKIAASDAELQPTAALLAPYIGLACVRGLFDYRYSRQTDKAAFDARLEQLRGGLDTLLESHLKKPCEPQQPSQPVLLSAMRDALLALVRVVLSSEHTLKALGGKSFIEFLIACIEQPPTDAAADASRCGAMTDEKLQQFLQTLPTRLPAAQRIPLVFSRPSGIQMSGVPGFFIGALLALLAILL